MNHSETDIALVEKYFDATMSHSELEALQNRLESDPALKTLFIQEKALVGAIRHEGLSGNLRYLKALETSLQNQKHYNKKLFPLRLSSKNWYYAAAASLVGIVLVAKIIMTSFSPTPDQLFEAYFTPYPNMFEPTVRSNESATRSLRSDAFHAYEQHNYTKAAELFNQLLTTKEESGILLLLGNSNLILGNIEEAKNNFTTLNNDFDDLDMQSKWYLSLCYLKSGDVDTARKMLRELGETEISYATKAKELLNKFD